MKKLIQVLLLMIWVIFWSFNQIAEARTGKTSSSSSSSSSRSSSSSSRSSSSSSSRSSSSSSSSFFSRSKTDSAFSNTAKTNQARSAWQERNKPTTVTPPPLPSSNSTRPTPSYTPSYERNAGSATDIQKQLSDIKTEQRLIGLGQVFSQWLFSNRHTNNNRVPTPPVNSPATVNSPINNTLPNTANPITNPTTAVPVLTPRVPATVPEPRQEPEDEGMSWFTILIIVGGTIWVIMWFKKRVTPTTIYRL